MRIPVRPIRRALALFPSSSQSESRRVGEILRKESVGGILLVASAALAVVWANSPWAESYFALRDFTVGPESAGLSLTLGHWAAAGLLAIFFFLVGLELKREFIAGDLRRLSTAIVPVVAAMGGVVVPALIYLAIVAPSPELMRGWAIPTATDIAFAVAVLAIIGSHLPGALRMFLLTLAVVDDFIAIAIIAAFYTASIDLLYLALSVAVIAVYALIAQRYREYFHLHPSAAWLLLLPIGVVAWALLHLSGIHATIAGVLLGFTVPVLHKKSQRTPDAGPGLAEEFETRFRPLSAGVAVPVFAFFSAGVAVGGVGGFVSSLTDPVLIGILFGLVVGKPIGITAATWIITRIRNVNLDPSLRWIDLVGVGLLAGIGFTVSLLVTELSFVNGSEHIDHAKVGIFVASLVAALLASAILTVRNRAYRRH
ncbi:MAG TPA: Na+/H+ antiporter NhaA [Terrimesophilobacter sp.]|nr:Na+/H+ antiporter NhaA [Terrimesophilobacter sp.]